MLVPAAVGVAALVMAGLSWLAMRRRRRVMADPLLWPRTLSRVQLTRYGNHYLRGAGWEPLAPWDFEDVRVRACKPGVELNIYVVDDLLMSSSTAMRDVGEKRRRKGAVVGMLTQQIVSDEMRREAELSGIFFVRPADLADVMKTIRRAGARHEQWRKAASAA
jgi:hypothetical protein